MSDDRRAGIRAEWLNANRIRREAPFGDVKRPALSAGNWNVIALVVRDGGRLAKMTPAEFAVAVLGKRIAHDPSAPFRGETP